jgi:hypothetical protein
MIVLVAALVTPVGPSLDRAGSTRLPSPREKEQPKDGHSAWIF